MIALQATLKGNAVDEGEKNAVITAPYVAVYDAILSYEDVRIADKETLTTGADEAHYATTFDACTKEDPRYKIPYDKEFNLKDLVATCFGNNGHDEFPIADYKLSYRFAVASTNIILKRVILKLISRNGSNVMTLSKVSTRQKDSIRKHSVVLRF